MVNVGLEDVFGKLLEYNDYVTRDEVSEAEKLIKKAFNGSGRVDTSKDCFYYALISGILEQKTVDVKGKGRIMIFCNPSFTRKYWKMGDLHHGDTLTNIEKNVKIFDAIDFSRIKPSFSLDPLEYKNNYSIDGVRGLASCTKQELQQAKQAIYLLNPKKINDIESTEMIGAIDFYLKLAII